MPLAHTFMRVGDEEALKAFDDMALASPGAEEMLKDRYLSQTPNLAYLAGLADGTLGKEFERYLTLNGLDVSLLRESAFIEAHHKRGDDVGHLAERGFQLHLSLIHI